MKNVLTGKALLSLLLAGSVMSASAEETQDGTITFSGFIYNSTCTIDLNGDNSPDAHAQMGRYPTSAFGKKYDTAGGEGIYGKIDISLIDCPDQGNVTLKLNGKPKNGESDILELDNPGDDSTAKNIGIIIYDRDGDHSGDGIDIDGSFEKEYHVENSASWEASYVAKYISMADDVEAGQANATLNYTLTYN